MDIQVHIQVKQRFSDCNFMIGLALTLLSSLDLLRSFYSEGLVDNRTFLTWLVLQMCACNLAQAGFVARLADEYLDGILACRALSRPFVDACLSKISEVRIDIDSSCLHLADLHQIRSSSAREYLPSVENSLKVFLQVRIVSYSPRGIY